MLQVLVFSPSFAALNPLLLRIVQTVAQECGISAMPTFQVWKGNQKVDELVGASKDKLQALVEKHV